MIAPEHITGYYVIVLSTVFKVLLTILDTSFH